MFTPFEINKVSVDNPCKVQDKKTGEDFIVTNPFDPVFQRKNIKVFNSCSVPEQDAVAFEDSPNDLYRYNGEKYEKAEQIPLRFDDAFINENFVSNDIFQPIEELQPQTNQQPLNTVPLTEPLSINDFDNAFVANDDIFVDPFEQGNTSPVGKVPDDAFVENSAPPVQPVSFNDVSDDDIFVDPFVQGNTSPVGKVPDDAFVENSAPPVQPVSFNDVSDDDIFVDPFEQGNTSPVGKVPDDAFVENSAPPVQPVSFNDIPPEDYDFVPNYDEPPFPDDYDIPPENIQSYPPLEYYEENVPPERTYSYPPVEYYEETGQSQKKEQSKKNPISQSQEEEYYYEDYGYNSKAADSSRLADPFDVAPSSSSPSLKKAPPEQILIEPQMLAYEKGEGLRIADDYFEEIFKKVISRMDLPAVVVAREEKDIVVEESEEKFTIKENNNDGCDMFLVTPDDKIQIPLNNKEQETLNESTNEFIKALEENREI